MSEASSEMAGATLHPEAFFPINLGISVASGRTGRGVKCKIAVGTWNSSGGVGTKGLLPCFFQIALLLA